MTITFPAGTPIRCNRCRARAEAPRAFEAVRENSVAWRIQDMMSHPTCRHPDGHWVVMDDIYHTSPIVQQATALSSGTLATLTGERRYDEIQEIQANFVRFCAENWAKFTRWQDAWAAFWRHEDDVCPDCGEDKQADQDFCDMCNAQGDALSAHYRHD